MDLRRLRTFHLVATFGRLHRAANQLKLTLPAISLQLKKLETELGVELFHHRPNKLILTDKGQIFLEKVNEIFKAVDKAEVAVSTGLNDESGKISISLGSDLSKFFAPQIVSFIKNHPTLGLTLLGRSSSETLSLVEGGEVDIGVGRFEKIPREVHREKLLENGVVLIYPERHPLSQLRKIHLRDLSGQRLITLMAGAATRRSIDHVFARNGIEIQNVVEVGSCQSALELVHLGLGVGLVHDVCISAEKDSAVRSADMSEFFAKTNVMLIYRKSTFLTKAHRDLIDALFRVTGENNTTQVKAGRFPGVKTA